MSSTVIVSIPDTFRTVFSLLLKGPSVCSVSGILKENRLTMDWNAESAEVEYFVIDLHFLLGCFLG